MKILDWYILKRYLMTFFVMMLLFIPIGIMVDLSEKVDKMLDNKAPLAEILTYYSAFTIYFANILFPIFLFLSIIWFTSKLANNTEIIAILSSGISFTRFLRPYFIGACIISIIVFFMGMFIVPEASKIYNSFYDKYLSKKQSTESLFNQFSENEYLYVSSFDYERVQGNDFSVEQFDGVHLKTKITASSIKWIENDSVNTYRLTNYVKRTIGKNNDSIETKRELDTLFTFKVEDLMPVKYAAETKNIFELDKFIEREKMKGSPNINRYLLVKYRRWGLVVTAFILTIIGVAVSSVKRRGGMGVNLAFGILIGFSFVFFDRVFGILAEKSGITPLMAVIIPNLIFLTLAIYLLRTAKR
ncbi:LptF/LptG family permease [Capnocytophaga canimorsus]|uniref:LptF/LptG family permease n=1 Tax=Capnocytophaga canimorsus TaxID=28188 RepID=UPI001BB3778D|nr:LptF/LptG family permease [Capnocytophaga canimorsus]